MEDLKSSREEREQAKTEKRKLGFFKRVATRKKGK